MLRIHRQRGMARCGVKHRQLKAALPVERLGTERSDTEDGIQVDCGGSRSVRSTGGVRKRRQRGGRLLVETRRRRHRGIRSTSRQTDVHEQRSLSRKYRRREVARGRLLRRGFRRPEQHVRSRRNLKSETAANITSIRANHPCQELVNIL